MFAEVSMFGDAVLNLILIVGTAGILYKYWFPNNEPGKMAREGFLGWLKSKLKL